jgi:hypothetical protein
MKILVFGSAACATLALAMIANPASAGGRQPPEEATPTARATPAKARPAKRYCLVYSITGSRIQRTVCKTRDEWMRDENFDPIDP